MGTVLAGRRTSARASLAVTGAIAAGSAVACLRASVAPEPGARAFESTVLLPRSSASVDGGPVSPELVAASGDARAIELLPDEQVAEYVREHLRELARASGLATSPVTVFVHRGVVKLEGTVPTEQRRRRILSATLVVRGTRAVIDQLRVSPWLLPDEEVETAVRARLVENPSVEEAEVSVSSQLGRVTLDGVVHSGVERETAEDLAWSVRGVRELWNRIRIVEPHVPADHDVRADVLERLRRDPYLVARAIDVTVEGGAVTLSGSVASLTSKARARELARVSGVRDVRDRLVVAPSLYDEKLRQAPPVVTANQIADALRDALRFDVRVPADAVRVEVDSGRVALRGVVPSRASRAAAVQVARYTVGVTEVTAAVEVRNPRPGTNGAIAAEIRRGLAQQPGLELEHVTIHVDAGRVRLRGQVETRGQSLVIERLVESMPGVEAVANELRVEQPLAALRDDEMLERDIESALYWDPRLSNGTVDVDVRAGVAILIGVVASRTEHEAVLEHVRAARPRGIEDRLERAYP